MHLKRTRPISEYKPVSLTEQYLLIEANSLPESGIMEEVCLDLLEGWHVRLNKDELPYPGTARLTYSGDTLISILFLGGEKLFSQIGSGKNGESGTTGELTLDKKIEFINNMVNELK